MAGPRKVADEASTAPGEASSIPRRKSASGFRSRGDQLVAPTTQSGQMVAELVRNFCRAVLAPPARKSLLSVTQLAPQVWYQTIQKRYLPFRTSS